MPEDLTDTYSRNDASLQVKGIISVACCMYCGVPAPQELHSTVRLQQRNGILFPFLLYSGMQKVYNLFIFDLAKNKEKKQM